MLAAVILAAGESQRMGHPKALLPYRGKTFLEHLIQVTQHPEIEFLRVVLGEQAEEILRQVPLPAASVVRNAEWRNGQLSSIQAAIGSLPRGMTQGMLLCPVDHPLVSRELVAQLIAGFLSSRKMIALPTFQGKRGHPMIFAEPLYAELLTAPPEIGARAVVWAHPNDIIEIPVEEEGVLLNLNDPQTLERAMRQ